VPVADLETARARWREAGAVESSLDVYHAHRLELGVPEAGRDYALGDAFPHEAGFDRFHGVDFDKGCFVGQEVVARMQHKTVVRKRVVPVTAAADLPGTQPDIAAGEAVIGRLGSVAGRRGLALLRIDRALEAYDKGQPLQAGGVQIAVDAEALEAYRSALAARAAT
jgi:folate-binding protein YgfZ